MPDRGGGGRRAARGTRRARGAPRRRAEPGAAPQFPPGAAGAAGRSQPHRLARPCRGRRRHAPYRRHGPPSARRGRSRSHARLADSASGHRPYRPSSDQEPRHNRRQPRVQRPRRRAASGDAGPRCGDRRAGPGGSAHHRGRGFFRCCDGDGAGRGRAPDRYQGSGAPRGDWLGLPGGRAAPGRFRPRGGLCSAAAARRGWRRRPRRGHRHRRGARHG